MNVRVYCSLGLAVLLACPASADEVRLRDGTVHIGSVERRGTTLRVNTRNGVVEVSTLR